MAQSTGAAQAVPAGEKAAGQPAAAAALGSATYDIIRQRLQTQAALLRERLHQLDARRQEVFGRVEFKLLQSDRISTAHNCVPQDMIQLGHNRFLFGFNVQFGLKKEVDLVDVFAIYERAEDGLFKEGLLDLLRQKQFLTDFKRLYTVYERAFLTKFSLIDGNLYMVFQIGAGLNDIAVFKWAYHGGQLIYLDGRAEAEFRKIGFPSPYEFRWAAPDRESFRYGDHPHVSIEDRVFVECVGGDLTIKIEDSTKSGEGIYSEPVNDKYQKVDDAEIAYAIIGHLILLKIRPYKEPDPRYFIFNEKLDSVVRVDSIGQSCVLLPQDHGIIFPHGFYLASGDLKVFEAKDRGMIFERTVHAINGEDSLYVFYNRESGEYTLLPYRLIHQKIEERITCHGFSLFPDGQLLLFRADEEPQKHHMVQLRQTPFYQTGHEPPGKKETFLYQVGNRDVVRCLAECNELLSLSNKENPYSELYVDLVKRADAILDSFPWLNSEDGFQIDQALRELRAAADKAVDEFQKVRKLQRDAVEKVKDLKTRTEERFRTVKRASFTKLEDYVQNLRALRQLQGELIAAREIRYIDQPRVQEMEKEVGAQNHELSRQCVQFLLQPAALDPHRQKAEATLAGVEKITKSSEARQLEKAMSESSAEVELLIEIVNGLQIEDATETTRIIDGITGIYSTLNQVKAALKKKEQQLAVAEGSAQFHAQMKLLGQSTASFLDLCDSPAKCVDYLNRISVQIEELEGAFADFEDFTLQLSEKRTSIYEAFEQRKVALVEERNKKTTALMTAGERILKVIQNRLAMFGSVEEIHAYLASDLMISKVRGLITQLLELGDSVKSDDLQGRLKSLQQDAVRQLRDRHELFADGVGVIQLGRHKFNVNTQPLDLTLVIRDGNPQIHLTSTNYFESISDASFLSTREAWDQELISENSDVYRAEYLAFRLLQSIERGEGKTEDEVLLMPEPERLKLVQDFMSARYEEGYTKGIHEQDASHIFSALIESHAHLQLARFQPSVRAAALVYWQAFAPPEIRKLWLAKLKGFSARTKLFPVDAMQSDYVKGLGGLLKNFCETTGLFDVSISGQSAEYLFRELISGETFVATLEAEQLLAAFRRHLVSKSGEDEFQQSVQSLAGHPESQLQMIRDWVGGFLQEHREGRGFLQEVSSMIFCQENSSFLVVRAASSRTLKKLRGLHRAIVEGKYYFDYLPFMEKMRRFEREVVPRFEQYQVLKKEIIDRERTRLRLQEFKPKVLTSFVRNQLIDLVYLPLVGDNLAKQMGAAGAQKRTDLMGLLLLISPPGYGKTTLVEYVANRLGIVFVKINGPALGHAVTSLDPEEASNAAAREEVQKLNLALEMGDNVMICLDDIQHCNPEFLQKFISLCDGQRKIEGVWKGKPRTYDLRGRKVVVVMAGNPYTESGQKFKIPDMLANRADTYNLGDIVGGNDEWFKSSYLENSITSSSFLSPLANKSQKDVRAFISMAGGADKDPSVFEGSYSSQEVEEILSLFKKMIRIREVVLKVNLEYIRSAGQADEFRTEPAFKLQGSYRNMNRLAEKVVPIMNDEELERLILDHYRSESQTLTTGAEANFLKLKEMLGLATAEETARWNEIKKTFKQNQLSRGVDKDDPLGRVIAQLSSFQTGLEGIQGALENELSRERQPFQIDLSPLTQGFQELKSVLEKNAETEKLSSSSREIYTPLAQGLRGFADDVKRAITDLHEGTLNRQVDSLSHEMEMLHSTLATLKDLAAQQRDHLVANRELLETRARQGTVEIDLTQEMLSNEKVFLDRFHEVLAAAERSSATGEKNGGKPASSTPEPPITGSHPSGEETK